MHDDLRHNFDTISVSSVNIAFNARAPLLIPGNSLNTKSPRNPVLCRKKFPVWRKPLLWLSSLSLWIADYERAKLLPG